MKYFLALATALGMAFTGVAYASPSTFSQEEFKDVGSSHPQFAAVEYLRQNNVLKGYTDGYFRPNRRITRAEFVTIMTNPFVLNQGRANQCIGNDVADTDTVFFSDVYAQDWFAEDVCFAHEKDIIHGYADGTFKANRTINFAEAAKIVARVMLLDVRKDMENDPNWYVVYIDALKEIDAVPANVTRPTQYLTRGQMAEIIYNVKTYNGMKNFSGR